VLDPKHIDEDDIQALGKAAVRQFGRQGLTFVPSSELADSSTVLAMREGVGVA
jgi:hypothetical protein